MSKHIAVERTLSNANPIGRYTMTLRDRNHNIIQEGTYPIHSAIHQYWAILRNTMAGNSFNSYTRIGGSGTMNLEHLNIRGAGDGGFNDARGIVVGTSSATVELGNVGLGGFIQSGANANELTYSPTVITYDSATGRITLSQTFTNDAVATEPTVNEVGIAVEDTGAEVDLCLIVRDVPGSSYVMLLDSVLTVSYEFEFPFGLQNHAMLFAKHQIARNTQTIELYDSNGASVNASTWGMATGAFGFTGLIGDASRGIIVGTDDTAGGFNTFALGDKVVHGSNTGELFYYDSAISTFEWNNTLNSAGFYISRVFKNKNTTAVTIREVGLSSNLAIGATNNTYLFDRRVLGSAISVDPDELVTITWAYKYNFT
jgi:hypothetical protein